MFKKAKNSKQKGNIGLGAAIAHFTKEGYSVSLPLTESQRYDLIVDDGTKLYRVEVKTSSHKKPSGSYEVLIKTCGGNKSFNTTKHFDCEAVDLLFILTEDGKQYCIPTSAMNGVKSSICVPGTHSQFEV